MTADSGAGSISENTAQKGGALVSARETISLIKKYGKCKKPSQGRIPGLYSVVCQKCGKEILTDSEGLDSIGYSITKRGTANFWHEGCKGNVWNSKIR